MDVIFDPDGFTKEAPMLKVRLPVYLKGDTMLGSEFSRGPATLNPQILRTDSPNIEPETPAPEALRRPTGQDSKF